MPRIDDMININTLSEPMWALERARRLCEVGREMINQLVNEPNNKGLRWTPLLPRHEFEIIMKYPESREVLERLYNHWLGTNRSSYQSTKPRRIPNASYEDLKNLMTHELQALRDYLIPRKDSKDPIELFGFKWPMPQTLEETNKMLRYRLYGEAWLSVRGAPRSSNG